MTHIRQYKFTTKLKVYRNYLIIERYTYSQFFLPFFFEADFIITNPINEVTKQTPTIRATTGNAIA